MKKLTLEEIGKLAGVSRATVSRVVNQHPNIRQEVRERVLKVIAETGYQPNFAARSLASNQSQMIGLIIPSILQAAFADPYYPQLIQGITFACNQKNYTVSLFLFDSPDEEQEMVKRIIGNGLSDGLILTTDTNNNPLVKILQSSKLPFVMIGRPNTESADQVNYVDVDNVQGAYLATRHLIERGYMRIGQIATNNNTAGIDRDAGYRKALTECGFALAEDLTVIGGFIQEKAYQAAKVLLPHKPDAIFAQSDSIAIGAIRAIREEGLRVPEDIAIVGFDDLPLAERAEPPLTTIRQPIQQNGALAVEMLIEMIQAKQEQATPRRVILPVELVIRASSGAVY